MRAFSSVAISIAVNGTRFAFRIVSMREVAETICEDPDVKLVNRYRTGESLEYDVGPVAAMFRDVSLHFQVGLSRDEGSARRLLIRVASAVKSCPFNGLP
jgi:hypothetical protein